MDLAFNSKVPFVPNPNKDPNTSRWIASLSDGSTVFEDIIPFKESAWSRLRKYVQLHNLKITNLRLEAYGNRIMLVPYHGPNNEPQVNGYWYSKKILAVLGINNIPQKLWCGIGFVKGKDIYITWIDENGTISTEIQAYKPGDLATIINDEI